MSSRKAHDMLPATRRLLWDDGPDIEVRGAATALDGWARPVQVAPPAPQSTPE